jgi:hypothetical protein
LQNNSLILKESQAKTAKQAIKSSSSCSYYFLEEPNTSKTTTNKVFLANTIRNTSSYNDALRKREEKELLAKSILGGGKVRKSQKRLKHRTREAKDYHYNSSDKEADSANTDEGKDSMMGVSSVARSAPKKSNPYLQYERFHEETNNSKFISPKKQRPILAMDEVLSGIVDPGPYGNPATNEPNYRLPEKCPW